MVDNEVFVLTRHQKEVELAQKRADEMVDWENSLALGNVSQKGPKKEFGRGFTGII